MEKERGQIKFIETDDGFRIDVTRKDLARIIHKLQHTILQCVNSSLRATKGNAAILYAVISTATKRLPRRPADSSQ